jgi:hypothetical protein
VSPSLKKKEEGKMMKLGEYMRSLGLTEEEKDDE